MLKIYFVINNIPGHAPFVQISSPAQAGTSYAHLQTLLSRSQNAPVVLFSQESEVPHLQTPPEQVSPATEQTTFVE